MDILLLVKVLRQAQGGGPSPNIGQGGVGGFLHRFGMAHRNQFVQDLSAHTRPGQAVDHAHLLRAGQALRMVAADAQVLLHVISCHVDRLYTV